MYKEAEEALVEVLEYYRRIWRMSVLDYIFRPQEGTASFIVDFVFSCQGFSGISMQLRSQDLLTYI
jgi:hypothetical protein